MRYFNPDSVFVNSSGASASISPAPSGSFGKGSFPVDESALPSFGWFSASPVPAGGNLGSGFDGGATAVGGALVAPTSASHPIAADSTAIPQTRTTPERSD